MNNLFNTELNYRELISKHGSPLLILDKATVRFQYKELARSLPNVTLHYALKPLPNKDVVASLIEEGASFDLASRGEIDLVRSLNINPMKCIHTHPIKKDQEIKYSLEYGCNTFVVDNAQEAKKFIPYKDEVKLLMSLMRVQETAVLTRNERLERELAARSTYGLTCEHLTLNGYVRPHGKLVLDNLTHLTYAYCAEILTCLNCLNLLHNSYLFKMLFVS